LTVILIDANNQMYRQGWVHRNLSTADGTPTGVLYGFLNMFLGLQRKYPDARFVCVWDGPRTRELGWRFKLYGNYKNRKVETVGKGKKIDIVGQVPIARKTMELLGIPQVAIEGVEADDMLSLLAHKVLRSSGRVVIHSSDKDFWQLVQYGVQVIAKLSASASIVTDKSIIETFGCDSSRLLDARVLLGDSSDKIPGAVRGIGPKRTRELLSDPVAYEKVRAANVEAFQRNYDLMRLPHSFLDSRFPPKQTRLIGVAIKKVLKEVRNPVRGDYRAFLAVLGQLELAEAMRERTRLYNLQF
jgi:DNA polymerase-1